MVKNTINGFSSTELGIDPSFDCWTVDKKISALKSVIDKNKGMLSYMRTDSVRKELREEIKLYQHAVKKYQVEKGA